MLPANIRGEVMAYTYIQTFVPDTTNNKYAVPYLASGSIVPEFFTIDNETLSVIYDFQGNEVDADQFALDTSNLAYLCQIWVALFAPSQNLSQPQVQVVTGGGAIDFQSASA